VGAGAGCGCAGWDSMNEKNEKNRKGKREKEKGRKGTHFLFNEKEPKAIMQTILVCVTQRKSNGLLSRESQVRSLPRTHITELKAGVIRKGVGKPTRTNGRDGPMRAPQEGVEKSAWVRIPLRAQPFGSVGKTAIAPLAQMGEHRSDTEGYPFRARRG
jgi:hypothetical protein